MTPFGQYLRQARHAAELSQRDLTEKVGIDHTYLSKIEAGRMPAPSLETLKRMGEVLGINPDTMIRAAGKVPPCIEEAFARGLKDSTYRAILAAISLDELAQEDTIEREDTP